MNNIPDELIEQLMAYLDGEMSREEQIEFEKELADSSSLQREASLMRATKNVVRSRSEQLRIPIPVDLERSIRISLANEVTSESKAKTDSFLNVIVNLIRSPVFAVTALLVAAVGLGTIVVYQTENSPSAAQSGIAGFDVYNASYSNFEAIIVGDLEVGLSTNDTTSLREFFRSEGVEYQVFFPEMSANLKGGIVTEHSGKKFAHVVYGAGDHLVYIFEVDRESVDANLITLEPIIAQDLSKSKWHWEDRENIGTMFVWESNNVVCIAVSDLRIQDFSALFTLETL